MKGKWICLVFLGLMLIGGSLTAHEGLKGDIAARIMQMYDLGDRDIEIKFRKLRLKTGPGDYDSLTLKALTRSEPRGLMSFRAGLFKNGQVVESGQITIKIEHYQDVLVTVDRIRRNEIITPDKFTLKRMETTSLTARPITSERELSGMWSKRSIRTDQILTTGLLDMIPTVLSGQGVSILYKKPGLQISARGTALQNGLKGEVIRVKNAGSKKIVTGTVMDSETVLASESQRGEI